jgi:DNA-binding NtrC family response regulator
MTQQETTEKRLIIIVDDEPDVLGIFSDYLTRKGFNVHAFTSPEIAFEHFRYSPNECSLLISDVRMPKLNGFELARKVKELNPNVRIILMSSFEINIDEFRKVVPNGKVDAFADKPISLDRLGQLVNKQLLLA